MDEPKDSGASEPRFSVGQKVFCAHGPYNRTTRRDGEEGAQSVGMLCEIIGAPNLLQGDKHYYVDKLNNRVYEYEKRLWAIQDRDDIFDDLTAGTAVFALHPSKKKFYRGKVASPWSAEAWKNWHVPSQQPWVWINFDDEHNSASNQIPLRVDRSLVLIESHM